VDASLPIRRNPSEPAPVDGDVDPATADLRSRLPAALPEVAGYLRRLAVRGVDPEDLLQDVMERALRYEHSFDTTRGLVPWLKGVALRVALDARAAARRLPDELVDDPAAGEQGAAADVARRDEVTRLLDRLPPKERSLLLAVHRDGRSVADLAAERDVPVGTLKSQLHRARRKLADADPASARAHRSPPRADRGPGHA